MNRDLPERPTTAEDRIEGLAVGIVSSLPTVGSMLGEIWSRELRRGYDDQVHQFLTEMKHAMERAEHRIGHVELAAFLAHREASAAFNAARDVASKTASRVKHRLLADAFVNVACSAPGQYDDLSGLFWSMIERHSVTEIRLLAAYDNPINRAAAAGLERGPSLLYGDYLFAAVPELSWEFPRTDREDASDSQHDGDDDDDEGGEDRPYWLYEIYTLQLRADGLIGDDDNIELDSTLDFGDEDGTEPDPDPKPFGQTTALGEEYLDFLALRDEAPPAMAS